MTFRPMPIMSVLAVLGLAILIWLGSWQWVRYQEKLNMPEQLAESAFVQVRGEAQGAQLQYVYTTFNGEALWRVFQAVDGCYQGDGADEVCDAPLFVDIGFLSTLRPEEEAFEPEAVSPNGADYVIASEGRGGLFGASDEPDAGIWYKASAPAMASALGLAGAEQAVLLEPERIEIFRQSETGFHPATSVENPFANPAKVDDLPPARHLGYALTWWGLGLGLIVIYVVFHLQTGRLTFKQAA